MSNFVAMLPGFAENLFAGTTPVFLANLIGQGLVELFVCSSALILLAWLLTLTIQSWSAAIRHRVWFLAITGL